MARLVVGLPVETKHPLRFQVGLVLLELVTTVDKVITRLAVAVEALALLVVTAVPLLVVTAEMAYQTLLLVLL